MTKIGDFRFLLLLFGFLAGLLCFPSEVRAAVKVQAFADRKDMGMGDTIDVTVAVSSGESFDVEEPKVPDLEDFQIVNAYTSNSTSSKLVQGANGMEFQTVRQSEFHYMLTPKKTGNARVPPFDVVVDGKSYRTPAFEIRVSANGSGAAQRGGGGGQGQQDFADDMDEAERMFNQLLQQRGGQIPKAQVAPKNPNEMFFIHLDLDKTEVYEGEQITANWYIYSKGNILALDRVKFPDLKGFWKEIIEEVPALNFTQEVLNGVVYRRALLASHALFPIKAGTSVIDEYKVKATVQNPANPFGGFGFGQPYSFTRSSDRVKINVKPLPMEGRPSDFSGAVGSFDVQASVEKNEVPINQPFSLKLRFEGEGNAKQIEMPALSIPAGIENYDSKSDGKFFKNGRSYKEFEVLLIPREPGEVTLPPITVSFFNPKTAKYENRKTEAIKIHVTGQKVAGSDEPGSTSGSSPSAPKSAPKAPVPEDLPGPLLTYESAANPLKTVTWPLFGVAGLMSLVGLGLKGRRELGRKEKRATLKDLLKTRVKKVNKELAAGHWREAATQMTNVIYAVLGEISGEGGATRELRVLLDKAPPSLRRDLGNDLSKTLDLFQFVSFAPEEAIGARKNPEELRKEIASAEKLMSKAIDHIDSGRADS